ncbi:histidinol dehydrogenase [Arthrobacter sp. MYb224]|uniref:histidinol dehydrogenase n=1 Tax=unclassified Arthrobacter TaxID=235627 RepID=UPI000CFC8FF1|nr:MULTISPECIES: histidinol dehydrogenase [unclassified Arthrobacter]PRA01469.1 histidinol dehydrogenase [Arthrobacter sp. MYb224]PRA06339.1 histidinol dehydrogenase [Arthrobacter sp. MYb229]PRB53241.1 histidinol dehydrogenase [Arthrobacter sp. MYb216]
MTSNPDTVFSELATIDWRGEKLNRAQLKAKLPRPEVNSQTAAEVVQQIIEDVREHGMKTLKDLAKRFDKVDLEHTRVPQGELDRALDELDPQVRLALEESISRARVFAAAQLPQDANVSYGHGGTVTQRWVPVRRVGLYVPGGLAVYPSSVIMNTVPAQAAGVSSLALASPPQRDFGGLPHPTILAAAKLLGITEVHAMGGAQAVAAFAYGVEVPGDQRGDIEPVDVISGPGNVFVATAKRLVKGVVGIDAEAGPTEIAILADHRANAAFVAADMISQAEHDANAAAVLVTDSPELAVAVRAELATQVAATKHTERVQQALAGTQSAIILVDDLEQGIDVCNAYAAEHLEVLTQDAAAVAARINAAGAIFVGEYAPVSLGDYCAGSNHVLPTSGTALHASGLNVNTFLKAIQVIDYDKRALAEVAAHVINLANAEDLPAHGDAVAVRQAL